MIIVFDENTPRCIAYALKTLEFSDRASGAEIVEVLHARDIVPAKTADVVLIQEIASDPLEKAALITSDKSMSTRQHERAAFKETGCIGIILMGQWSHASMWERARMSVIWWKFWVDHVKWANPGTLWQSPWLQRPKRLKPY